MPKRRISKQQKLRIENIQTQRRQRAKKKPLPIDQPLSAERMGLLVTHYGKYADVEADKNIYRCHFRQNLGTIVVGDQVIFCVAENNQGVIVAVSPRKSLLYQLNDRGEKKAIAANIDQMLIVIAPEPLPSTLLLDQYLIAAELLKISPIIIFNKIDLITSDQFKNILTLYKNLNYLVLTTSCIREDDLAPLTLLLNNHTSVFVGQSGVGKSSLIQALLPDEKIVVGKLHEATRLGTHTTTTAKLYHLIKGGNLIDSPGIRAFTLWPMSAAEIAKGFKEFQEYIDQCKFRNCSHTHEPDCKILEAVAAGEISNSRWENYKKIIGPK